MKNILFILLILGVLGSAKAQESLVSEENLYFESEAERFFWNEGKNQPLSLFRAVSAAEINPGSPWINLVEELDQKRVKESKDLTFLRQIFQKTHQSLLKKYEQHSTFNDMLEVGKYDCVSGSAALGMLLDRYGFKFDIVETDYHVFIVAEVDGKNIILESTLPIGGMITAPSEVAAYLEAYKQVEFAQLGSLNQRIGTPKIDLSNNAIFRKVSLNQLAGLLYYNDAILLFNNQKYQEASNQLSKALALYPSERIEGLKDLTKEMAYKTVGHQIR
ncbi:MAG: hypothetical protein PSV36_02980 [Algoriphagus sp.]|nr:hypothetical protein [Algoriphagus sp.]